MKQEGHEPDTLERLLGEWMGEEEPENKAALKIQNISSQEEEKEQQKDKKHRLRPQQKDHGPNTFKSH